MQRNGSETLSPADTSPTATLTSEALPTSRQTNCAATPNATSLQASEDGRSLSVSPDGPTTDLFGQALAPASPSALPARARRSQTNVTFGLRGFLSSPSAALQSSLESRLRRRLDGAGSTLFSLTWKARATPAGRPYYQRAASGRRTSETDFGSWPTPTHHDDRLRGNTMADHHYKPHDLPNMAELAAWPAPMAGTPAQNGNSEAGNNDSSRKTVALAGWRSPAAQNGDRGGQNGLERVAGGHTLNLQDQAMLATWATPRAEDSESSGMRWSRGVADTLTAQASLTVSGTTANGSGAPTEKQGQLDPDHSRWVMGYSAAHLSCAPTETPSFLKSRRTSSRPA